MNGAVENLIDQPVIVDSRADILTAMTNPATALAIWQRDLANPIKCTAAALCLHSLDLTLSLNPFCKNGHTRLYEKLDGLTDNQLSPLIEDILSLSQHFAELCACEDVRIRIETVTDDGCSLFHVDNVVMRLVVTYAGAGTQWVRQDFSAIAHQQQTIYTGPLQCLETGDVAIFRGKKSGVDNLIFHRSPPHESHASPRLVVVIDRLEN